MKGSAIDSWTKRRLPAQHTSPWLKKMPLITPSIAWSMGASSKMMLAALPPSSSVSALSVPATARPISLPTDVEPVKATLSTSGCLTRARPISPGPVMMLTTPGGRSAWRHTSAKKSAVSGVELAGLSTTVLPAASAGAIFQASISSGKFHGMTCARDAERLRIAVGERVLELVRPAGVVPEVRRGERHVDVARLLDGLAAVERLEHGELAAALLQDARDAEQVLGALAAGQRAPVALERAARDADGLVDVLDGCARDLRERLFRRRIDRREPLAAARRDFLAADEQPVARLELDDVAGLRRRRVFPGDLLPIAERPAARRGRSAPDVSRLGAGQRARGVAGSVCVSLPFIARLHPDGPWRQPISDHLVT